jgi:hypothetical protein
MVAGISRVKWPAAIFMNAAGTIENGERGFFLAERRAGIDEP